MSKRFPITISSWTLGDQCTFEERVKAAKAAKEALDDEAKVFVCAPARRDYAYVEK